MKKFFLLSMTALLLSVWGANAQNYCKWDFTNWSATTVANLKAGTDWSDDEKNNGTTVDGNCFWQVNASSAEGETLTANGGVINELNGLLFTNTKARALAIAVNYPSTSIGDYHGPQYLWLGSKDVNYFVIPKVKPGTTIKMGVESHKPAEARGVNLFIGHGNTGTQLTAPDGSAVSTPTTYEDQAWIVPTIAEDEANDDGTYDITVRNTNGCHIYYIEVGDNTQKSTLAYLCQGAADGTLAIAKSIDTYNVEPIDITKTQKTAEELRAYDAVIIASNVTDAAYANVLKDALAWTPIVNTSSKLYDIWGLGKSVNTEFPAFRVDNPYNALFNGVNYMEAEGINVVESTENVMGVTDLDPYFANDIIASTDIEGEFVTSHIHNNGHNAYIYVSTGNTELMLSAIRLAANSKAEVTQAPAPTITLSYKNMNTDVTLSSNVPMAKIYYTTDGSVPTESSTPYTGTFNVTAACTVKAVVSGDGYLLSEVGEKVVDLKSQATAPTLDVVKEDGQSIVTISGEGTIWYNYSNVNDTASSSRYSGPVVLKFPKTLYAFTTEEDKVSSDIASIEVGINNIQPRIDIVAHMDANSAEYNEGSTSTAYYFSWGKNKSGENGYPYYNPESYTEEIVTDPETGDETVKYTYTEMNPEEEKDFGNGWMVRSRGQLTIWENQTTGMSYGNTSAYNYATVDDYNTYFPATKSYINLADKNTIPGDADFPYNAYIVSTSKFKGPFDIVANIGSIVKTTGSTHTLVLQTSTDGYVWESNWQTVGDTIVISDRPRLTTNVTRSYEGSDEVYVRAYLCGNNSKAAFYDIYIATAGEKSQELKNAIETGIAEPAMTVQPTQKPAVYSINGVRQNSMKRGLNIVVENGAARKVLVK